MRPALLLVAALASACSGAPSRPDRLVIGTATSADGVPIRYSVYGQGEIALVLVHGWCCDSRYWDWQVLPLGQRYRVVTLDLAGHGQSGANRRAWTMPAFGADVAAVVRSLGLHRVVLVGHSMGGNVVVEAARLLGGRVIGVVGVDTLRNIGGGGMPANDRERLLARLRVDFPGTMRALIPGIMFTPQSDPKLVKRIVEHVAAAPPQSAVPIAESMWTWDPTPALAGTQLRLTLINAAKDPTDAARIRGVVPGFELKEMQGVGHFPMIEDAATFNRLLEAAVRGFVAR